MSEQVASLQILLDHERERVQTLVDLLAVLVANAGGFVEITPHDVASARGKNVEIDGGIDAGLVLMRLTEK